jgi:lambda repressor-like predicted transcriptional regulator
MDDVAELRLNIGEKATAALRAAGLPVADLAKRAGLPEDRVRQILDGCADQFTLKEMADISRALGSSINILFYPPRNKWGTFLAPQRREKRGDLSLYDALLDQDALRDSFSARYLKSVERATPSAFATLVAVAPGSSSFALMATN